jgi:hypothetical protein
MGFAALNPSYALALVALLAAELLQLAEHSSTLNSSAGFSSVAPPSG